MLVRGGEDHRTVVSRLSTEDYEVIHGKLWLSFVSALLLLCIVIAAFVSHLLTCPAYALLTPTQSKRTKVAPVDRPRHPL